ncbi:MAG: N-acetylmuramoyl-L-alanine amidase [Muribaculum sp.]|nr:N-acetylmuramoyl-L-alanine amidase [Muribaculum sp.]
MHKRRQIRNHIKKKEYRLVRCGEKDTRIGRKMRMRRAVTAGFAFALAGTMLQSLAFWERPQVQAAEIRVETVDTDVSGAGIQSEFSAESVEIANEMLLAGFTSELPETIQADTVKERCDILVAIDPGHGGEDEGCSRKDVLEKEINLQIAQAVEQRLTEQGYQVLLLREGDESLTLEERVNRANRRNADLYVSIHQNACEEQDSKVSGIEVWYNATKGGDGSERLARLIHNNLIQYSGAKDRDCIADESLYVIRETQMPACLVETGFLSNRQERELLATQDYQDKLAEGIASGIDLYFFPKTMYLTFDDGPSEENTAAVLDILKEHNIKATFFLVGENVEKHPEMAKRIADEGHTIGIHCYNHAYDRLYESVDSYVEDFEKAWNVVYETTGVEAKLFRFPGGSINAYNKKVYKDIIEEMTDRGYIYFDWNASLEDATKHNEPELLVRNAKESTLGRRRIVMLAHDVVYNTTLCLEEVLEQFPEYRMLPLSEEVEPIQF